MQNETMIYGYARVSTAAQDETGQVRQLKAAGREKVLREKITGTTADRPQLGKLMKRLAPGDVVITPAVDRLSRDTTDLLVIAREMQRAGAGIRSLAEPYLDTTSDFAEIIFTILGVAAKLERRRILERTARGRADAKANRVKFGRKPTLTPHQQKEARKRLDTARRSAASRAVTTSVKARFLGSFHQTTKYRESVLSMSADEFADIARRWGGFMHHVVRSALAIRTQDGTWALQFGFIAFSAEEIPAAALSVETKSILVDRR